MNNPITISAHIHADIDTVWNAYITPEHVKNWNAASEDWYCPEAGSNFRVGGEFHYTMAARDGSGSFDFWGTFTEIREKEYIAITLGDERKMSLEFQNDGHCVNIVEQFEAEKENSRELQKNGWQSILNHFAEYCEDL